MAISFQNENYNNEHNLISYLNVVSKLLEVRSTCKNSLRKISNNNDHS